MPENIDFNCALLGQGLARECDAKLLTDALSVLQEQGLYAFFLYLKVCGKEPGQKMSDECVHFLERIPKDAPLFSNGRNGAVFQKLQKIAESIDDILFARDLLMQALVYARYHAKAKGGDKL
ncbi:hypothetical protein [Desulfotomaculum copahuensis]|uniref:CRISPR type III-B/RAMP module-associated protein Cmr5 n=1 Tax=Desulfotomaculum copahuensis TaxID=1838280 RepID=A0A1B7LAI4_9FIRM|nr:hypothetical protein [Desulfotomaculum copahuensis]OAT79300.1 hypothetical protein A6M21_16325 [Desulfotomaculum copahuensis]